ncbi:hypothetical protein V8C43DRAFT_273660 [Trichoderma afarasin]
MPGVACGCSSLPGAGTARTGTVPGQRTGQGHKGKRARYRYAYDTWTKASACCRHLDLVIKGSRRAFGARYGEARLALMRSRV